MGEGFGLMRLKRSKTAQAAVALRVTAFSTYLIGLCISSFALLEIVEAWQTGRASPTWERYLL